MVVVSVLLVWWIFGFLGMLVQCLGVFVVYGDVYVVDVGGSWCVQEGDYCGNFVGFVKVLGWYVVDQLLCDFFGVVVVCLGLGSQQVVELCGVGVVGQYVVYCDVVGGQFVGQCFGLVGYGGMDGVGYVQVCDWFFY